MADDWDYRIWPRNLTQPWTWRATNVVGDDEESRDDPDPVSLEGRWHIANYLYSLRKNSTLPGNANVIKGVKVEGTLPIEVTDAA